MSFTLQLHNTIGGLLGAMEEQFTGILELHLSMRSRNVLQCDTN